jgi:hypothetical protein
MKKLSTLILIMLGTSVLSCLPLATEKAQRVDMTEQMKRSLVYLRISACSYDEHEPWKQGDISNEAGYGCAVSEYEVITTAWNVANARLVEARIYGESEYIPVRIKVIDYENDLCLIELDRTAMPQPLRPIKFTDDYRKGAEVDFYWLSSDGHLYNGRGYLDRAEVTESNASFSYLLNYVLANTSKVSGRGQVNFIGSEAIGVSCWWSSESKEAELIPAMIINRFLADAKDGDYKGFGAVGFETTTLLDPTKRAYLKMPQGLKDGVYVSDVYNLGTGSDVLKKGDVILSIDGKTINPREQFEDPRYGQLSFEHLITSKAAGESVVFELWRDGQRMKVECEVKNFNVAQMLVPYYEYDHQPEYVVTGGFVLQKLTRPYLAKLGENWEGQAPSYLYNYYSNMSFKPTDERRDIVILSYVLPAKINLGYADLGQIVVSKFNGMPIHSIKDILTAQKFNPDSKYDVIEFELDNPKVVIPREQLPAADALIGRNYGIRKLVNVNQ